MNHRLRLFSGLGAVFLIYAPLRLLEEKPAIFFILMALVLSYGFGFLLNLTPPSRINKQRR